MAITARARVTIDTGTVTYAPEDEIAEVTYVDESVPKEFLAHAYDTGKVYIEDVSADPWVRRAKARHAMRVGETLVAADGAVCDISTDTNIGTDVILRMREGRLANGLGSAAVEE